MSSRCASTSAPGSRGLRTIPGHRDIASVTASPGVIPTASGEASVTFALRPSPATSARGRPHRPGSLLRSACRAKSGTARTAYLIRPGPRPPGHGCAPSGRRAGRPGLPRRAGVGQRERGVEDKPPRDCGHERRRRLDEDGDGARLRGALQAVPGGRWRPPQHALRAAAQVEDNRGVVAVAHEDVRHGKGLCGRTAAHPHEMAQRVVRNLPGRESVRPVDERHPLPGGLGSPQEPRDHRLAPAARDGRYELRQAPRGQAAPEGVIDRADRGGRAAARPAGPFREARGKERPQRGDGLGGAGHLRSFKDDVPRRPGG
jgi:hypothetical protein